MEKGGRTHSFETHSKYSVLTLNPVMNDCAWSEIEKVGDEVLREIEALKSPNLVVDLSELEYIGSAMVALVVRIWKAVKAKNSRMVVVSRHPLVLEVFKIAKLNEVWTIVEFREDALEELGISPQGQEYKNGSPILVGAALIAALAAAAMVGLNLARPGLVDPMLQMSGFGLAIIGIVAGVVLALSGRGGRRAVGIFATLLSIAVCVAYFFPPTDGNAQPDGGDKPKQATGESEQAGSPASANGQEDDDRRSPGPAVAEKPSTSKE